MNRGFIASLILVLSLSGCAYQSSAEYPQPPATVQGLALGLAVNECSEQGLKPPPHDPHRFNTHSPFSECVDKKARSKRIRDAALRIHRHDVETYPQRVQQYQTQEQMDQFQQQQQQAAWQNVSQQIQAQQAQQRASMPTMTTTDCRVMGGNTLNCTSFSMP
jgi:hypothetical protein